MPSEVEDEAEDELPTMDLPLPTIGESMAAYAAMASSEEEEEEEEAEQGAEQGEEEQEVEEEQEGTSENDGDVNMDTDQEDIDLAEDDADVAVVQQSENDEVDDDDDNDRAPIDVDVTLPPIVDIDDLDDDDDDDVEDMEPPDATPTFQPEEDDEVVDFLHLADSFKEPLFVLPASLPSPALATAYSAQKAAGRRHDEMRKRREAHEVTAADELGRLQNLIRESRERERASRAALRRAVHGVYEAEAQECPETRCPFNDALNRLRAYVRKNKGLPPTPPEDDEDAEYAEEEATPRAIDEWWTRHRGSIDDDESNDEAKSLGRWLLRIRRACDAGSLPPHRLAALECAGVDVPLSDDDKWHRSLRDFRSYVRDYYDRPMEVQATGGDVARSMRARAEGGDGAAARLAAWCREQQERYEDGTLLSQSHRRSDDRYERLVESGFAFDVHVADRRWEERVEAALAFRDRFGSVHVPEDYRPRNSESSSSPSLSTPELREFVDRVRSLLHRDALSPKRLDRLKRAGLYADMGGRVFDAHARHCREGRAARGEEPRVVKRKFAALAAMAGMEEATMFAAAPKRVWTTRGSMENWTAKLEKLVAYKEKHGSIIDIQNDVKLRQWTYSIIRKLSINSTSLRGEKMEHIERHEGLREYLLRKEHVEAASEEARARKGLEESSRRDSAGASGGEEGPPKDEEEEEEDNEEMEDSNENSSLGNEEDNEEMEDSNENASLGNEEDNEEMEDSNENASLGKKDDEEVASVAES